MIYLILALHNHQPVGNFDHVFREAFEKCYDPFLKFLEEHPSFRVSLHYSGCLFDWLAQREKQFLRRLERLVRRDQVELLGGGYYEPILSLIPERDAVNQLRFMNQYLEARFEKAPAGFWLTERVWESKIPRLASEANLRYTAVDDTHFALAGLSESSLKGIFITEEEGHLLYLFPIPKVLRYVIPFREPPETLDYLRGINEKNPGSAVVTYADDGEKFGLWPGTYQWVYREGWLERFASALEENQSWISLKTFREVLPQEGTQPAPKVYLPSASYEEMAEWAMVPEKGREFQKLRRDLESVALWNRSRAYFQGGLFKNFLVKYPEADWMRAKMQRVSRRVSALKNSALRRQAERELWQGQCNCPYWHGVFGGLYLHHLRRNTYEHLIRAEQLCHGPDRKRAVRFYQEDMNLDGAQEGILESSPFSFYFLPHRGGSLVELDYHPLAMNLTDTLTRREETYHEALLQEKTTSPTEPKSIHDLKKNIPAEVINRVVFDPENRFSFLDYFLEPLTSFEVFWKGKARMLGEDPVRQNYEMAWKKERKGGTLSFKARRQISTGRNEIPLEVIKSLTVIPGENYFVINWILSNESAENAEFLWGMDWRFNFFDRNRVEKGIRRVEIQDGWSPVHLTLKGDPAYDLWQFPLETVAQSERDYPLLHQGISVFPHWHVTLSSGKKAAGSLTLQFSDGTRPAE